MQNNGKIASDLIGSGIRFNRLKSYGIIFLTRLSSDSCGLSKCYSAKILISSTDSTQPGAVDSSNLGLIVTRLVDNSELNDQFIQSSIPFA